MITYFFLFCPNNSGTTIMSQYLADQAGAYLPPFGNFEGQMAPGAARMMRTKPWNPNARFDWGAIKPIWDNLAVEAGKQIFVEASPPNLMRIEPIIEAFRPQARFALGISDPYASIASTIYNYEGKALGLARLQKRTNTWLKKAAHIQAARVRNPDLPFVTYEAFCADPTCLNRAFDVPIQPIGSLGGKNGGSGLIVDMTARNILFHSAEELDLITGFLSGAADLIAALGYRLAEGKALIEEASVDPAMREKGLARRREWDATKRAANARANKRRREREREPAGNHGE